jgi:PAS domain S-box-containing protein
VNPAFTRNTGFTLADIVGRKPGEILQGPDTDPETAARISAAVRNGEAFDVEIVNYTKDRKRCWIRLTGNPVREEDGTISRFIAVQTDITARREAEARAAEASRLSALGQLAGGVAHDMNNLLMVISLNLELLAESGLAPQAEGMAQAALGATMRGHDLTKQLLSFAQRAADHSRVTDVGALLGTIVPLLAKAMPEGVRFVSDLRCSGSCRVDAGALESALTNLVMNARDALGGRGAILVECARRQVGPEEAERLVVEPGAYMRLTVSDDGPGIPRELLGRVLEPFFTTKASGKGTGLGLSMAYGFARQAGGTLTIESTQGEGTTVTLLLPLAQAAEAPCAGASGGQLDSVRGLSALIVDDEPQILVLLERMLRSAGLEVTLALDPAQARASLDARRPDVLLADVRLADGASGIELALAARVRWPGLPVIFMTGDPGPEFAERIAGFEDAAVLQKPFGRAELTGAVKAAVPGAALALAAPA